MLGKYVMPDLIRYLEAWILFTEWSVAESKCVMQRLILSTF